MRQVENEAKKFAIANGKEMFGRTDVDELKAICNLNFRSSIKPGRENYSDTFKTSVESHGYNDKIRVFIGDENSGKYGCIEDVKANSRAVAIVELKSLWVVDGKFGLKYTTAQIKLNPRAQSKLNEANFMAFRDGSKLITEEDGNASEDEEPPAKRQCTDPADEPPPEADFE